MIVIGIDLSLTSTGIATITDNLVTVNRITSKPPTTPRHPRTGKPLPPTLQQRAERLNHLRQSILAAAWDADLIVIEAPAFDSRTGHQHDRSGLWWLTVHELNSRKAIVEVTGGGRAKYATGKGGAGKDAVLAAVVRRYLQVDVTGNDEADSLILAAMGARHLGSPIEESLPQTHLSAMDAVRWPALEPT